MINSPINVTLNSPSIYGEGLVVVSSHIVSHTSPIKGNYSLDELSKKSISLSLFKAGFDKFSAPLSLLKTEKVHTKHAVHTG